MSLEIEQLAPEEKIHRWRHQHQLPSSRILFDKLGLP
jgi:hypothetical protein